MKTSRLLLVAFVLLATGIALICAFTHGSAGFDAAIPVDGTRLHFDLTTTGWPALVGTPCLLFGVLFLALAFFSALAKEFLLRKDRDLDPAASEPDPYPRSA